MKNIFIALSGLIAISICPFTNSTTSKNVTSSSNSIFRDNTTDEINEYYKNINEDSLGDDFLANIENVISPSDQKELVYAGGNSSYSGMGSVTWYNYLLADRDWVKDPLTSEEETNQIWKKDDVICDVLYDEQDATYKSKKFYNDSNVECKIDREHVWPESHGFQKPSNTPLALAGTDIHNLHMGEHNNNSTGHNNYVYGDVKDKTSATQISSTISSTTTGYRDDTTNTYKVYEPLEEDKGDIARSIFYMATRYRTYKDSDLLLPQLKLTDDVSLISEGSILASETKDTPAYYGILSTLLEWNEIDPVDEHEMHRNNLVYNAIQGNRNPYIDHPEWVKQAFLGEKSNITYSCNLDYENTSINISINNIDDSTKTYKATYSITTSKDSITGDISLLGDGTIQKITYPTLPIENDFNHVYEINIFDSDNNKLKTYNGNYYGIIKDGKYSITNEAPKELTLQERIIEFINNNLVLFYVVVGVVALLLILIIILTGKKKHKKHSK
ncbi:MAG: endonuclease [Bacilli bacterium]